MSDKKNKKDRREELMSDINELAKQGYLTHNEAVNYTMVKNDPILAESLFIIRADAARRRRKKRNRFKYFKTIIESIRSFIKSMGK